MLRIIGHPPAERQSIPYFNSTFVSVFGKMCVTATFPHFINSNRIRLPGIQTTLTVSPFGPAIVLSHSGFSLLIRGLWHDPASGQGLAKTRFPFNGNENQFDSNHVLVNKGRDCDTGPHSGLLYGVMVNRKGIVMRGIFASFLKQPKIDTQCCGLGERSFIFEANPFGHERLGEMLSQKPSAPF